MRPVQEPLNILVQELLMGPGRIGSLPDLFNTEPFDDLAPNALEGLGGQCPDLGHGGHARERHDPVYQHPFHGTVHFGLVSVLVSRTEHRRDKPAQDLPETGKLRMEGRLLDQPCTAFGMEEEG